MITCAVVDGTVHALGLLGRLAKERAMVVAKGKRAGWVSAAVFGGMAVGAPACSSSSSTGTNDLDSGMPDAIVVTPTRESGTPLPKDAGNGSSCNTCATAAYAAGGACGSFVTACLNDGSCKALATCANGCAASDTTCLDNCAATASSTALNEYQSLSDCICGSACIVQCAAECGTSPDSGMTPVDSGSMADAKSGSHVDCTGCDMLTDVSGYCGNAAGTTQVCDCPYGSPSTSCSATPGAANTWCCP